MRDEFVRKKAVQIVQAANVKGHDELGEIRAVVKWVQRHMVYRKDPFGVEFFHTARRLIKDIEAGESAGDCDDFVILGGALLGSLGYPVGALIVDSNNDGVFNHVMLVTKTFGRTREFGDNWIPCELIYPEFKLAICSNIKSISFDGRSRKIRAPIFKQAISGLGSIGSRLKTRNNSSGLGSIVSKHPYTQMLNGLLKRK